MNRVMLSLTVFLLAILTNRSALATRFGNVYYDQVKVTVYNEVSRCLVHGSAYSSSRRQDVELDYSPKMCSIKYDMDCSKSPSDLINENCTIIYYDEEHCDTDLIQLATTVKEYRGKALIYQTAKVDNYLRKLDAENVDLLVILMEDEDKIIWSCAHEAGILVNVTVLAESTLPPTRPPPDSDGFGNERSTTTFYFVVFAFTILLLLSLTWFIFNYLRRCHHMYTAKRRRAEMLSKTRKAIDKCPTKTYKKPKKLIQKTSREDDTDSITSDDDEKCAICLESYKTKDMLRVLPCHHEFHKTCIDPWLFEKGTCPMCKLSIVGNQEDCLNESTSRTRDFRMLAVTQPAVLDLGSLEEGLEDESIEDQQHENDGGEMQIETTE